MDFSFVEYNYSKVVFPALSNPTNMMVASFPKNPSA